MKLYTEEQVKHIVDKSRETGLTAEYLILTTPTIELPSDEEVDNASLLISYQRMEFIKGAKWMKDKILNK